MQNWLQHLHSLSKQTTKMQLFGFLAIVSLTPC